jgi:hypothetical protein
MYQRPAGELTQPASLVELLERAGVTRSSLIRVTGPNSLPALLWLCRHGYEQVACGRTGEGWPHEEEPDAIVVAHTCGELELKLMLAAARQLKPGGAFIFRVRTSAGASAVGLEWLLKQFGLSVHQRIESGRRALIIAHRTAVALRKAA